MTDTANLRNSAIDCPTSALYAPLIITGMHRSGTSLTASLLNKAGLHVGIRINPGAPGNPLGYFENLDFVRLNERILNSLGYPREGWTFNSLEKIPERFYEDALETITLNATEDMWGFKDPRTALMLDFWHENLPQARFLLTARAPWQVADSLFRRGDSFFKNSPRLAIEVWHAYNENILRFYRRQKGSCLLACLDNILENPGALINAINEKFGMQLRIPEKSVFEEGLLQRQNSGAPLFEEIVRTNYPRSLQLWKELQHECQLKPAVATIERSDAATIDDTNGNAFELLRKEVSKQQAIELLLLKLKKQSREKQTIEFARDTLAKENALLKLELSQARASQENHGFEINRHEAQIEELRTTVKSLTQYLSKTTGQLQDARLKTHLTLCQLGDARLQLLQPETGSNEGSSNQRALEQGNERAEALQKEIEELKATQSAVLHSRSWRVTAPLRRLSRLTNLRFVTSKILTALNTSTSTANPAAVNAVIEERHQATCTTVKSDPLCPLASAELPQIDMNVVTYNSSQWIKPFVKSLTECDYPASLLKITFGDNNSTDATLDVLKEEIPRLETLGYRVSICQNKRNLGFGAAHNALLETGNAPFCLITNVDLTFEPQALSRIGRIAQSDDSRVAAWELRQKPYEHPKFYDPVTGITNWNSHACVLVRREAFQKVRGYDENLFLYGEDVELSYRFRRAGYVLRYCPVAAVWHYSYEAANQVKPLQFKGSTFANLYLRIKYGTKRDMLAIPNMCMELFKAPEVYPGSTAALLKNVCRLAFLAPSALLQRSRSKSHFPFRDWDYELTREGAFVGQEKMPAAAPLVSVITRTRGGRNVQLRQALLSVAHQTYPNIEQIVVEDGGRESEETVKEIAQATGLAVRFISQPNLGRSAAGNTGLAAAKGKWCLFLDDDDLLFADHVETLAAALTQESAACAAYSIAWMVLTAYKFGEGRHIETCHSVSRLHRQDFDYSVLTHHNYMPIQSVLFERRLVEERGGMDEGLDSLEDWNLWLRFAFRNRFLHVPKVTSLYREPSDNQQNRTRQQVLHENYNRARQKAEASIKE
ncbi:MAG: glycosyltransferase, partial [Candidatus Melainabacteria bacterium]|nr:glycosyltransferase [Candidatus Melainabacteria bacterium]